MLQNHFSFRRQAQATGCAVDQNHSSACLHLCQSLAGGSRGDAQLARCRTQTAATDQSDKKSHFSGLDSGTHDTAIVNHKLKTD